MTSEKLESAIQLIQEGDRQAAVPLLRGLIQEDHTNEDAWLLLYTCMDELEHKKFCLQSVLTINPANQEAREALDALTHSEPAPVEFSWAQPQNAEPDPLQWDEQTQSEEIVLERPAPQKIERKKMEWERSESEQFEQEQAEREKVERKRIEREKAELERVDALKMEWERTETERAEKEKEKAGRKRVESDERAEAEKIAPPTINWDEWDAEEPAKPKPVKVTYQSTPYRKPQRNRQALFSLLAMMVLFLMSFTVCMVFVIQLVTPPP